MIIFYGDYEKLPHGESVLYVSNHPSETDWFYSWALAIRKSSIEGVMIILKDSLRLFPGAGWAMENLKFIFLSRHWQTDEAAIAHRIGIMLKETEENNEKFWMVIFPEGTNIEGPSYASSKKFSEKMGIEPLEYLLQPRSTGFVHVCSLLRAKTDALYDVTIAFEPETDSELARKSERKSQWWEIGLPTLFSSLSGKFPQTIHYHVKRYEMSEIPEAKGELAAWLGSVWRKKDERIRQFYATGTLDALENPGGTKQYVEPMPSWADTFGYVSIVLNLLTVVLLVAFLVVWPQWWLWAFFTVTFGLYISCSLSPELRRLRGIDPPRKSSSKNDD
eukprot:TRINITY_DN4473_c0_g1_i1.p1 TRINITY_DN4473_c0_g1~~TRINITY_DN4473_c0_g1_i1.p1  ORF type:complete len:333 (+),score=83.78 TRINITY_DN4473_c0_g1_i1:260-1258(+)